MRWLLIVLIGSVLVSAWAATIPSPDEVTRRRADAQVSDLNSALLELREADGAYREFARADSLLPLLPAAFGIRVALSPALDAEQHNTLTRAIAGEAAEVSSFRARVGVFVIDREYGSLSGLPQSGVPPEERELYVGTDSAGPYCAVVATGDMHNGVMRANSFTTMRNSIRGKHLGGTILGPCTFVARYGAPGARIDQWLRDGAYRMAEVANAHPVSFAALQREEGIWTGGDLRMRGCAGGRMDLCQAVVMNPMTDNADTHGAPAIDLGRGFAYASSPRALLLRDIEAAFGPGRFADFWASDEDVDAAFATAFGIDVGSWMREWSTARYGPIELGAGLGARSLLFWAMTMLVLGAVALVIVQRRSI